jgi:hypothetical protein
MAVKLLISLLASPKQQSQPLDAFLCFDVSSRYVSNPSDTPNLPAQVEATCVADKQIDWPNEIIVRLMFSQKATEPGELTMPSTGISGRSIALGSGRQLGR